MFSFKLTLNAAIVANMFSVLRGEQTGAGITIAPAIQAALNGAWGNYVIQHDPASPAAFIRVGGVNISSGGTDGQYLTPGESTSPGTGRYRHAIGNVAIVSGGAGAIINIDLVD